MLHLELKQGAGLSLTQEAGVVGGSQTKKMEKQNKTKPGPETPFKLEGSAISKTCFLW